MVQSDALSHWPDLCPDEDTDNDDIIMLPDELFVNLIDAKLQERIATADDLDEIAAEAQTSIGRRTSPYDSRLRWLETGEGEWEDCFVLKNYIPQNQDLWCVTTSDD